MKKLIVLFLLVGLVSCSSTYYAVWEKLGKQKRDLLRDNAIRARAEQVETNEQFKDALTKLREAYPIKPTELAKTYDRLNDQYERSVGKAEALKARIDKLNRISKDLFSEWKSEAGEISSDRLRDQSLDKLSATKEKYEDMHQALRKSYSRTEPVLQKFKDNVLFLKHNLNAQVVGSLDSEAGEITEEIESLIGSMNQSIAETDKFIGELG
jgi:hypothetical protein